MARCYDARYAGTKAARGDSSGRRKDKDKGNLEFGGKFRILKNEKE